MQESANSNDIFNDVMDGLDDLHSSVTEYQDALMDAVSLLAKEKKIQLIPPQIALAEKIELFIAKIEELKKEWQSLDLEENHASVKSMEDEKKGVHERTEWWIADDSIKIETKRLEGAPYSNVIPLSLFKEIAKVASDFVYRKKFVKTSDVLQLLKYEIITHSDYKKTPRIPVYATFKVLVKEKVLKIDDHNSHKYIASVRSDEFFKWVDAIGQA